MKKKTIGMFVLMLVSTTTILPVTATVEKNDMNVSKSEVDVPIWSVGDSWTYQMEYFESDPKGILTYSVISDITIEVTEDSEDSYKLIGMFDSPKIVVTLWRISLKPTKSVEYKHNIEISKEDLGLVKWDQMMEGIFLLCIGKIPLPIPIQFLARFENIFQPAWNILPFPLYDGKSGNLESVQFKHDFEVSMFRGLIPINVGEGGWELPQLSYTCTKEQIAVPAGTYNAYRVRADQGGNMHFTSYYNEEVGNVVKETIYIPFEETGTTYFDLDLSLKSTTYS
jgi:hypothetical protein